MSSERSSYPTRPPSSSASPNRARGREEEEEWTKINDPVEKQIVKKRVQNRVAQRGYRFRLKQRLAELQNFRNNLQRLPVTLPQNRGAIPSPSEHIKVPLSVTINTQTLPSGYGDGAAGTLFENPHNLISTNLPYPPLNSHSKEPHSTSDAITSWPSLVEQQAAFLANTHYLCSPPMTDEGAFNQQVKSSTLIDFPSTGASDLHECCGGQCSPYFSGCGIDVKGPYEETDNQISPKSQALPEGTTDKEATNLQKSKDLEFILKAIDATQFKSFDELASYFYSRRLSTP